ncbi:pre-rRNA-processing protein TSR2 homolog [Tribolium madens]|uniref:pre-rRNA-processing protein TSR2 homolog n=1 Tax=Tribolium madens TaxID=41895 RepID=UPI001CF74525|nr:pre-rRNA-processing protein TSR2 homolog [Tribolium madens]
MEEAFNRVVQHIFNNWTALKLAVEYSESGCNPKEVVNDFINYTTQYCLYESNVEPDGIQEALDDILDQEFDTICEDGSTKEIALLLYRFVDLLKQGNTQMFEEEYQKLPIGAMSSSKSIKSQNEDMSEVCEANTSEPNIEKTSEIPMEEDSEWTEVKSRRRR